MAGIDETRTFHPLNIAVLTISDTRDEESDKSGGYLADALTEAGHKLAAKAIVPDDVAGIQAQVKAWADDHGLDRILPTGRPGFSPPDFPPPDGGPEARPLGCRGPPRGLDVRVHAVARGRGSSRVELLVGAPQARPRALDPDRDPARPRPRRAPDRRACALAALAGSFWAWRKCWAPMRRWRSRFLPARCWRRWGRCCSCGGLV